MVIDNVVIEFVHFLCEVGDGFFGPFFLGIRFLGEKAWFFLLIAVVMCLKKKTRWVGATIILAIFLSFIIGDVIMKPLIARPRPFQSSSELLYRYWLAAGQIPETDFSMPSGHTLGVTSFFASLYLTYDKRYRKPILIIGIICIILMIFARCYFMHHYFTDCVAAFFIGIVMSIISKYIVRAIFNLCKKYPDFILFDFALNFDALPKTKKK